MPRITLVTRKAYGGAYIAMNSRALGATQGQIRTQFLSEAVMLASLGGVAGVAAGALTTAIYANTKGWAVVVPVQAWVGGIGAAVVIGAIAGLLPALRAE